MVSEKKFALQTVGDTVVRNNQTNEIYWNHNLVHLINSLSKENEQLHQKNTKLIAKIDFLERVIDGDV